jgi:hypothetical protein
MANTTTQNNDEGNPPPESIQDKHTNGEEYNIPDYVDTTLLPHTVGENSNPRHSDKALLEMIHTASAPFISTTALTDISCISKPQMSSRLKKLTEIGILKSVPAGDSKVYWLNHPDSEYPVPSDVKQYLPTDEYDDKKTEIDKLLSASYFTLLFGAGLTLLKILSMITSPLVVEANYGMLPITIVLLGVLLFIHTKIAIITRNEEYSVLPDAVTKFNKAGDQ